MKPEDAAYLAGLMDGEGCFRLWSARSKATPIGRQYRVAIEITMCDKETMEFVSSITGKHLALRKLKSGRVAYKLHWHNRYAADLLRIMFPYLRGKKEQARLLLHFQDEIAVGRGKAYTAEDQQQIEQLSKTVSALKRIRPFAADCPRPNR